RYNKTEDTTRCGEFDLHRDSIEFASIAKALKKELPIIGICRGMQIFNISQGGSLFIDLPDDFDSTVSHRTSAGEHDWHPIEINQTSLLFIIIDISTDSVYSHHHQGINKLASNLRIVARSPDGLAEAIEWKSPAGKSYFMAVQFHPERMNITSSLSKKLALSFIHEVVKNKNSFKK
ncbi:MAG: gamma-glutamyl-gamma-aminobutyrate hydrolase family protein, partial [Bacteroidales bacterium]|nr:gamma-glutamyl-gamma-aminobutyrate hydrolase family protein [Bacteroidales bacterium]